MNSAEIQAVVPPSIEKHKAATDTAECLEMRLGPNELMASERD